MNIFDSTRKKHTIIMGIINTSPESFYSESVHTSASSISATARRMQNEGADIIDVGGMSTAPYLKTFIKSEVELHRVVTAVKIVRAASSLPISIDTCRANVAEAALDAGADIINDVTGLQYDSCMSSLISRYRPSLVLCAYGGTKHRGNGLLTDTSSLLKRSTDIAFKAGVHSSQIAIDPAIGFFRRASKSPFFTKTSSNQIKRDLLILKDLNRLGNMLVLVSISRKSFLRGMFGSPDPKNRLPSSLACEMFAIQCGANIIRTHNVRESRNIADMVYM
ncbi:MAG: dihydropteroate synthase (folP) [Cenarchaeum symbiont of Oopsacas minuta]|nr:dihydropteroate synthase (folP) [Cenarchaeum symbiont of Oopsacas minuta]